MRDAKGKKGVNGMKDVKGTMDAHAAGWAGEMTEFRWSEVKIREKSSAKAGILANGRGFEPPACSLGGCRHIQTRPPVR